MGRNGKYNVQGVPTSSELVLTPLYLASLAQAMRNAQKLMVIVCLLQLFGILQQFCSNSNSSRHVRPPKSNICLDFSRGEARLYAVATTTALLPDTVS